MTDKVFIHELTAFASIGAYEWEHTIKQKLIFNIEMDWDFSQAVETENLQYCLNYAEISQKVLDFVESQPFKLVETVAYKVADLLQQQYGIKALRIELHKPKAVAQASSVGVIVERHFH
ncbi:dihydroneopterin aldolase [Lonepinella koalarum]|uniref:7,8-dihydroneopterin aldolase n=1 Tax=Lonepinella koalarum TaxID=53417 RepID=A0A4R1KYH4_9PAST|nr:dihydroneopterin aldolase [Lonepinella koalarum]MDH2926397.1 dihydroneopterin aldolase [Lonepinella koalarum]TCK69667.1 dihydroneopterin aldolase [Lonepinella koalarum]TFJ89909.1 dihydroneopterin aldolase [Lonepinella koalarum]